MDFGYWFLLWVVLWLGLGRRLLHHWREPSRAHLSCWVRFQKKSFSSWILIMVVV